MGAQGAEKIMGGGASSLSPTFTPMEHIFINKKMVYFIGSVGLNRFTISLDFFCK